MLISLQIFFGFLRFTVFVLPLFVDSSSLEEHEKAKKAMNEADKIKITREYMSIADEIYRWDQYRISGKFGNIVVAELDGRKVARLPRLRVDRPNLLEALIGTFNRN